MLTHTINKIARKYRIWVSVKPYYNGQEFLKAGLSFIKNTLKNGRNEIKKLAMKKKKENIIPIPSLAQSFVEQIQREIKTKISKRLVGLTVNELAIERGELITKEPYVNSKGELTKDSINPLVAEIELCKTKFPETSKRRLF